MQIFKAKQNNLNEIIDLLKTNNLPAGDLPSSLDDFFVAVAEEKIVGLIGMERYDHFGLLRSMVVDPAFRNRHIAETLVQLLEKTALETGIKTIYLLTETAEKYFTRKGYINISRENVPAEVKQSTEFRHVCPVSATVMKKDLIKESVTAV